MKLKTNSQFLISVIQQVKSDYSPIIMICGKQRRGKSNMGLAIGNLLMEYFHKKPFDPETNLFFDPIELLKRMDDTHREPLIVDEAGVLFNAQEFYSHLNIAMSKIIQSQGYLNNIYILILPMARNLAKMHRNYINFRLTMIKRGYARVHKHNVKYEDFREKQKGKTDFIFLEHFMYPFFDGDIWNRYQDLANQKKESIRHQLTQQLIAIEQSKVWICRACNTENIKGMIRCQTCNLPKGYGS